MASMKSLATGLQELSPLFKQVVRGSNFLPAYAKDELDDAFDFIVETLTDTWSRERLYPAGHSMTVKAPASAKDLRPTATPPV